MILDSKTRNLESRLRLTANVNLHHVTKFSLNSCFTAHYFYPKISSSTLALSITIFWAVFNRSFSILRNS